MTRPDDRPCDELRPEPHEGGVPDEAPLYVYTPPVEVEQGNELVVLWLLGDEEGFWAVRSSGDGEVLGEFWQTIDALAVRRERRFMTSAELG